VAEVADAAAVVAVAAAAVVGDARENDDAC
jgi:hypothetical protein